MNIYIKKNQYFKFALSLLFMFVGAQSVSADSALYISPASYQAFSNEVVELEVYMDASVDPINAVGATIDYNPEYLELISYRRTSEKVSFWIENKDDPYDGSILLEGLLMDEGWKGKREKLARISFRTKKVGQTDVGIEGAALHIYDGTGNNIIDRVEYSVIDIKAGSPRDDYRFIAQGVPDVDETLTPDVLYDDEYQREFRVEYIFPWWVFIILAIAIILFVWSFLLIRKLNKRVKNYHHE